jgi:putative tryptophan/tyrosine transport system substrate-binding protein
VIDRRTFTRITALALLVTPFGARAQPAGKVYRVGILRASTRVPSDPILGNWLVKPLQELGYVEGQNLIIEARYAEDKFDRLPGLARELMQRSPDVIVAVGTSTALAFKDATTTIPIVFLTNVDPVEAGLVSNLARPGGNVTGVLIAPEGTLAAKKLEILKELVPPATRFALLVPDDPNIGLKLQVQEARKAASALGVELVVVVVRDGDYGNAFATIGAARPGALLVGAHSFFVRDRKQIVELAGKYRLPAIYEWPQQVKDGGLMSYGANDVETYRRVALYVDQILKGAKPGDLPIWQPSNLRLVINLKTAKALGITIPPPLLLRADEVIQ